MDNPQKIMIEFNKKAVYTFDGTDYPTLEEAQVVAIAQIDPLFDAPGVAKQILNNAAPLTAIFKQSPRVRSSPRPKKRAPKPAAAPA